MRSQYQLTIYANPAVPGHFFIGLQGPDRDHSVHEVRADGQGSFAVEKAKAPSWPGKVYRLADRAAADRVLTAVQETEANADSPVTKQRTSGELIKHLLDHAGVGGSDEPQPDHQDQDRQGEKDLQPIWDETAWDRKRQQQDPRRGSSAALVQSTDDDDSEVSIDDAVRRAGHVFAEGASGVLKPMPTNANKQPSGHDQRPGSSAIDEVRRLLDEARQPICGVDAAMEKHPSQWTRDELLAVQASDLYGRPNPGQEATTQAVADWYKRIFGDAPLKYDDTGRMMEAEPLINPPKAPIEPRDARGHSLNAGVDRVAQHLASASRADGSPKRAIRSAQRAFNLMRPGHTLKEDGLFGPKSKKALRESVRLVGPKRVEEGLSLGRFATFAEQTRQRGTASSLATETERTFGPLFHQSEKRGADWSKMASPRPSKPSFYRPEAVALQETINDLGREVFGQSYKVIQEDGWIGPKTTEAFQGIVAAKAPDDLARHFGVNLGFLSPEDL